MLASFDRFNSSRFFTAWSNFSARMPASRDLFRMVSMFSLVVWMVTALFGRGQLRHFRLNHRVRRGVELLAGCCGLAAHCVGVSGGFASGLLAYFIELFAEGIEILAQLQGDCGEEIGLLVVYLLDFGQFLFRSEEHTSELQ